MRFQGLRLPSLLLIGLASLIAACDGGFDDEEARARCDQERSARGATDVGCVTDEVYEECLDAYAECGSDVLIAETCPTQFSCPAE